MTICTVVGQKIDYSNKSKFVTIVGTENASGKEMDAAFFLGRQSVLGGFIVVSGLARGIDTAAHCGALSVEGDFPKTVAILSTSDNEKIYPKENCGLAEQIKQYGAIIHPYQTRAIWGKEKFSQPQKRLVERDVIQAILSQAIFAVNGPLPIHGGTRWAMNYGEKFGARVMRYDPDRFFDKEPNFKRESGIWWDMELDYEKCYDELKSGSYNFIKVV